MSRRRVVITGLGCVSPVALSAEESWQAVLAGKSGVAPITLFDTSAYPVTIGAEVKGFDPLQYVDRKEARKMDRFTQFAIAAAQEAVTSAGLEATRETGHRIGVMIGSGIGGIATLEREIRVGQEKGPDRLSPFFIPMMICDMASGQVSIRFGFGGPNSCVVTACATGTNAIGDATAIIRRGDADAMVAGGAEAAITPMGLGGFAACRALSTRNEEPTRASRPFDGERDGFIMGEGAAVLVLEELEHARARGAQILAEVVGYGMSADAFHITMPSPDGEGAVRAMRHALREAEIEPEQVDYINAHGTSTVPNDKTETAAVKAVMGEHAYRTPMSSTKSMTGHLLGAAGAIEAMFCVQAIRDGQLPPTINLENPDPACDLDYVPNVKREHTVNVALSNSFGFGGHNATLVIQRYQNGSDSQ
ncbi:MAG TPA: beta-ketoacyl-ACP synthase II [Armatimonadota bacterium]|nr:beta-ketoacyl-ACP synthase II [Armatimonadota bacterium]